MCEPQPNSASFERSSACSPPSVVGYLMKVFVGYLNRCTYDCFFIICSTLTGLKESMPSAQYISELMKLWDKQKTLEEKFEEEKDSHLKAQVAQEDQLLPVKSEPAKKKIKAEVVPTIKRDLFYGTPLSSSSSESCSSSSSDHSSSGKHSSDLDYEC